MASPFNAKKLIRRALDAGQDDLTEAALSTALQVIEDLQHEIDVWEALVKMRREPLQVVNVSNRSVEASRGV